MNLVIRCNYGDDSIALLQWLHEHENIQAQFSKIYVCYIDTGWSAISWPERVVQGESFCQFVGFVSVYLKSPENFEQLCLSRNNFPSQKFQWCAGFLKGVPFLEWIDEHDPECEWMVAIPKRQALYRKPITEYIEQCEYHGDRQVWHPIIDLKEKQRDVLINKAGFSILGHHSLECAPCVNSTVKDFAMLSKIDIEKTCNLESQLQQNFMQYHENFPTRMEAIKVQAQNNRFFKKPTKNAMDHFSMGCGDPFGCGL